MNEQLLNGVTPDTRLYRVFPLARALDLLKSNELVLVRPSMWEDPFENLILNGTVTTPEGPAGVETIRDGWYGQCWTTRDESDAMCSHWVPTELPSGSTFRSIPARLPV